MNTLMKVGIGLAAIAGVGVAVHVAHAAPADPVPAVAAAKPAINMPASLEASIRAAARAHAPQGTDPAVAETHMMKMLHAHLSEVAKDPALVAQVNAVMTAAANGDQDAMEHIHHMLMAMMEGGGHH